jgi:hypothetical protein
MEKQLTAKQREIHILEMKYEHELKVAINVERVKAEEEMNIWKTKTLEWKKVAQVFQVENFVKTFFSN